MEQSQINERISKALRKINENKITCDKCNRSFSSINFSQHRCEEYTCEKCGNIFHGIIGPTRKIHCDTCKRKVPHSKNPANLEDLSSRTQSKILKRAGIGCLMCGWDKASLDVHHITPRKIGGSNDDTNLICICPNCHRMAHEGLYSDSELRAFSVANVFSNWRDYYHPSN